MKNKIKKAFIDTIPVMTGYLVLGAGFGILMNATIGEANHETIRRYIENQG